MTNEKPEFEAEVLNLASLASQYSDNGKARSFLESVLWPKGPVCPHCKNTTEKPIYKLNGKAARAGVYKCGACRKQFTVTVGTIFEDSHIPISKWLMAVFVLCSSKKAISSHQIHRMLGITYKTAWFMTHRIRHAMGPRTPLGKLLAGSREHLPKYANEFAFRWNQRKVTDGERTVAAIKATEGKRLTYRQLV